MHFDHDALIDFLRCRQMRTRHSYDLSKCLFLLTGESTVTALYTCHSAESSEVRQVQSALSQ